MKKIKLQEAAGVPNFIYESSVEIYEEILKNFQNSDNVDDEKNFLIKIDFKVGDIQFKMISLDLKFFEQPMRVNYDWIRMAVTNRSKLNKKNFFEYEKNNGVIVMSLDVAVPINWEYPKFIQFFIEKRKKFIETISHELMHIYEINKKGVRDPRLLSHYIATNSVKTGIRPLDKFTFFLYYISLIENVVRPTEVYSYLKLNQANTKNFIEFLKDNDTYKELTKIKNFSYENMKNEMMENSYSVNRLLDHANEDYNDLSGEERVNLALEIYYGSITNIKIDTLSQLLSTNFSERILGFAGEKEKFYTNFIKRITRFKNYDNFFKHYESKFKFVAEKMIKRISKVYSLLDDKKEVKIQESIINWDLYHEINRTQEKFLEKIKNQNLRY